MTDQSIAQPAPAPPTPEPKPNRIVIVHAPIEPKNFLTGKMMPVKLGTFDLPGKIVVVLYLEVFVLRDPKLGNGLRAAETVARVRAAFADARPGNRVELTDADWAACCSVINAPSGNQDLMLMSQLAPFGAAFVNAEAVAPKAAASKRTAK